MTTSEDEPMAHEPSDDAMPLAMTAGDEHLDLDAAGDPYEAALAAPPEGGGAKRWVLAILAALGAAAVGVAIWAVIYAQAEREYVGVAVIIGLAVGWLVRSVSGRSTLGARILASLITAAACVAGTMVGDVAFTAKVYRTDFWKLLKDALPDTFDVVSDRPALSYVIFAAAIVLAFLSAGPQKPKAPKTTASDTTVANLEPGYTGADSDSDADDDEDEGSPAT